MPLGLKNFMYVYEAQNRSSLLFSSGIGSSSGTITIKMRMHKRRSWRSIRDHSLIPQVPFVFSIRKLGVEGSGSLKIENLKKIGSWWD